MTFNKVDGFISFLLNRMMENSQYNILQFSHKNDPFLHLKKSKHLNTVRYDGSETDVEKHGIAIVECHTHVSANGSVCIR